MPPRPSCVGEKLPAEEDLSEEVYYSDEDEDFLLPGDTATSAVPHAENLANPQTTEVHQDAAALLSQLASGSVPSQATIELAIAQLLQALMAEEKQLMGQLVQQMAMVNPVLAAANPLALQVEAIRILLTTRGQRALVHGLPGVQQMAVQAQAPNLPRNDVSPGVTAQADSIPAASAVNRQTDMPGQSELPKPRLHHSYDESAYRTSVAGYGDSVTLNSDARYPDECSSGSSDHVRLGARSRPTRGRGRGMHLSGPQYDDDMCREDRPRGRGIRRGRTGSSAADETNALQPGTAGSAAQYHPLVPPPLHQGVCSESKSAVDSSENWEQEIDEFGSDVFQVESSFYKFGRR